MVLVDYIHGKISQKGGVYTLTPPQTTACPILCGQAQHHLDDVWNKRDATGCRSLKSMFARYGCHVTLLQSSLLNYFFYDQKGQ